MAFAHASFEEEPSGSETFWRRFVHISPHASQEVLIERFRRLCPWIQSAFDGYTVDMQYMSEAAWAFLDANHIPYDNVTVPRDQD